MLYYIRKDRPICAFRYAMLFDLHWMNLIYSFTNLDNSSHHGLL